LRNFGKKAAIHAVEYGRMIKKMCCNLTAVLQSEFNMFFCSKITEFTLLLLRFFEKKGYPDSAVDNPKNRI
jgi:hypothetical protein